MSTAGFSAFLARKNIKPSAKLYFVDAMSAMAMGLFASLLIGTILDTLGDQFHWDWLVTAAGYASSATGIAIAVAIGVSLSAPPLVLYSLCAVGLGSYSVGGPLGAFFAVIVAAELGKAVSRETKVDILVTPTITILSGLGIGTLIGPGVSLLMNGFGQLIEHATQLQPFWMGILVSVLVVEKLWLKKYLDRWPVLGHLYMLVLIPVSWAVFSVSDFGQLGAYFGRLFPLFSRTAAAYPLDFLKYGKTYGVFLILGLLCSTSLPAYLYRRFKSTWVGAVILAVLFWLCLYCLSKGMNDPFMYFRF